MKLKQRAEKYRDEQAQNAYWSHPERYNMDAFKMGFNSAMEFLLAQKEIKNMEDIREFLKNLEENR